MGFTVTEILIVVLFITVLMQEEILGKQHLCVRGKVICSTDEKYTGGQRVKLWDKDTGPNLDDLMAESVTNKDGSFHLCGSASDTFGSAIDPIFKIYTRCEYVEEDPQCFRKLRFKIGQQFIGGNYTFTDPIDLSLPLAGESRRCFTGSQVNDFFKRYTGSTLTYWLSKIDKKAFMKLLKKALQLAASNAQKEDVEGENDIASV